MDKVRIHIDGKDIDIVPECRLCQCWVGNAKKSRGECRRHSPRFTKRNLGDWPCTGPKQFCGEFRPSLEGESE
jgi:hypothetical protein